MFFCFTVQKYLKLESSLWDLDTITLSATIRFFAQTQPNVENRIYESHFLIEIQKAETLHHCINGSSLASQKWMDKNCWKFRFWCHSFQIVCQIEIKYATPIASRNQSIFSSNSGLNSILNKNWGILRILSRYILSLLKKCVGKLL